MLILISVAVGALLALLYPRAPTWQIRKQEYVSVKFNYDLSADLQIAMDLEVFNPNFIPSHIKGIRLEVMHKDVYGEERPMAEMTVTDSFIIPMKGSKVVPCLMTSKRLPMTVILGLANDMKANNGMLVTRALAHMEMYVVGKTVSLEAECEQHIQADVFPMVIKKVDCKFYSGPHRLYVLPTELPED